MEMRHHSRIGLDVDPREVRRVAVLRALHLGDFLCSVPALRALRGRFPMAEITLIGLPWVRPLIARYACLDRFLEFPGHQGLEGVDRGPEETVRFAREARKEGYDLAIQMHGDGSVSNGFVALLGARMTIGYCPIGVPASARLDLELVWDPCEHEVLRWLRLVGLLGAEGSPDLEFPLMPGDWTEVCSLAAGLGISLDDPIVGIHPGARDPARRWPPDRFATVANVLSELLGAQVVVTGTSEDAEAAALVASAVDKGPVRNLVGRTSLGCLAAMMARMSLFVTNDTGPAHLAAAVGTPSVVVFGPTSPRRWAPLDSARHRAVWSGPGLPIEAVPTRRVVEESLAVVEQWVRQTY